MTADQDPIPVILVVLVVAVAMLCYATTGHPFPPAR